MMRLHLFAACVAVSLANAAYADAFGHLCRVTPAASVDVIRDTGDCRGYVSQSGKRILIPERISGDARRSADGRTVVFIGTWLPSMPVDNPVALVIYRDDVLVASYRLLDLIAKEALRKTVSHRLWVDEKIPDVIGHKTFDIRTIDARVLRFDSTTGQRLDVPASPKNGSDSSRGR